ncbi:PIN domain-like protein [Cyathus striatus]|nr:PIN domain-like protein [Cyathus striatus]
MGVLGLTPFLHKTCPDVFKQLPKRFQDISGKKIVIDGTLITQRLHFVQSQNRHRHVIGWYRIARDLRASNVQALCVFDGLERNLAKAREATKRRKMRMLTAARGSIESERFNRLNGLRALLPRLRDLRSSELDGIGQALHEIETEAGSCGEMLKRFNHAAPPATVQEYLSSESTKQVGNDLANSGHATDLLHPGGHIQDQVFPSNPETDGDVSAVSINDADLPKALASLYLNYKNSIKELESISADTALPVVIPYLESEDVKANQVMTKAQRQLAVEEGRLWKALSASSFVPDLSHEESPEVVLNALTEKSAVMTDSFHRRTNVPTAQTYDDSKEILQAMGFPCIETTGAYEAEALASSLVLQGYADYVASEDSDVIVYEAPMIRNLSNSNDPLIVLSGSEIRKMLGLSKASFIDFALLLGTDFSQRIKGLGPLRAFKLIKEYGTIERILDLQTKYMPDLPMDAYLSQIQMAREVFQTLPPIPTDIHNLHFGQRDDEAVSLILQRCGLGRLLMEDTYWDHEKALNGNYFNDDPSALNLSMPTNSLIKRSVDPSIS